MIIDSRSPTSSPLASFANTRPGRVPVAIEHTHTGALVGKVVHLVDLATDDVFSFLAAASSALADAEVEQTIVFVNTPKLHGLLPRIHASVRVVVTPPTRNPLRRWLWALRVFRSELERGPTQGVHLYGRLPSLVGTWVARRAGIVIALHQSPYGSALPAWFRGMEAVLRRATSPPPRDLANDNNAGQANPLSTNPMALERPVNAELFTMPRNEARRPLIVTGSDIRDPSSADLFAQLAVLLGGEDLGLAFNWVGNVEEATRLRLKAAQVGVVPVKSATEWASRLAAGWVYLAPGNDRAAAPSFLVQAMALGLPCVAVDTPDHRNVIRHGENGYLCRTAEEIVSCIAPLIDSQELRRKIGQAARLEVEQRFGETKFRDALFAAYQLPYKTSRIT